MTKKSNSIYLTFNESNGKILNISKNLFNIKNFFGGKRGLNRVSKFVFFYFMLIDQSISNP